MHDCLTTSSYMYSIILNEKFTVLLIKRLVSIIWIIARYSHDSIMNSLFMPIHIIYMTLSGSECTIINSITEAYEAIKLHGQASAMQSQKKNIETFLACLHKRRKIIAKLNVTTVYINNKFVHCFIWPHPHFFRIYMRINVIKFISMLWYTSCWDATLDTLMRVWCATMMSL